MFQVLKYRQRKFANCASFQVQSVNAGVVVDDIDELVQFLNACILPKDERKLKEKLQSTRDLRLVLLSQNDACYPKIFEFYLVDSKMVKQKAIALSYVLTRVFF